MRATARRTRSRERHEGVRRELISSLLDQLQHTTFAEIAVDDLARDCGISRSGFYSYFRDKTDVLMQALSQAQEGLLEDAQDIPWPSCRADVTYPVGKIVDAYEQYADALRAAAEVATYDAEVNDFFRGLVGRFAAIAGRRLTANRADGVLADGVEPEITGWLFAWMVERACYWEFANASPDRERLILGIDGIWGAFYAPATST